MTRLRVLRPALRTAVVVAWTVLAGCGSDSVPPADEDRGSETAETSDALATFPWPDVGGSDPAVREQLTQARAQMENRLPGADTDTRARLWSELAQRYHAYDLLEAAEVAYGEALRADPGDRRWAYLLGTVHQRRGELDAAAPRIEAGLQLESSRTAALWRLGSIARDRGETDRAVEYFREAVQSDPACFAARADLAALALEAGDAESAIREYEAVLSLQPGAVSLLYPLAQAYRAAGRTDRADEYLQKAAARDRAEGARPSCPDPLDAGLWQLTTGVGAHLRRALQARLSGRLDLQLSELRAAEEIDPRDPRILLPLADVLAASQDLEGALERLERLEEVDPDHPRLDLSIGSTLLRLGRILPAESRLIRAVEKDPSAASPRLYLGLAFQGRGRHQEAIAELERVLEIDPEYVGAALARAVSLAQTGRRDAAIRSLEETAARFAPTRPGRLELATFLSGLDRERGDAMLLETARAEEAEPRLRSLAYARLAESAARAGDAGARDEWAAAARRFAP